jgi:DNA invertase Pin-like site-specific DNA recombinase
LMSRERIRAGHDAARARGRVGGRPCSLPDKELEMAKTLRANLDLSMEEVASRLSGRLQQGDRPVPARRDHAAHGDRAARRVQGCAGP